MKDLEQCYCGHLLARHMYNEPPIGGWCPGDPEPVLEFAHCGGMAPHGDHEELCPCKAFQQFPFGLYRHLKTGNVYEVVGLAFNADDRAIEVEYISVAYGEKWHRPLYAKSNAKKRDGFFDPDDTGRPRFEFIPNPNPKPAEEQP